MTCGYALEEISSCLRVRRPSDELAFSRTSLLSKYILLGPITSDEIPSIIPQPGTNPPSATQSVKVGPFKKKKNSLPTSIQITCILILLFTVSINTNSLHVGVFRFPSHSRDILKCVVLNYFSRIDRNRVLEFLCDEIR